MSEEYEEILLNVSTDLLREVEEYEKREYSKQHKGIKKRYPSNEDIVNAIKELTGGSINRYIIDELYDSVRRYLEEKGFDISILNESRFWRLTNNLIRKGCIRLIT